MVGPGVDTPLFNTIIIWGLAKMLVDFVVFKSHKSFILKIT